MPAARAANCWAAEDIWTPAAVCDAAGATIPEAERKFANVLEMSRSPWASLASCRAVSAPPSRSARTRHRGAPAADGFRGAERVVEERVQAVGAEVEHRARSQRPRLTCRGTHQDAPAPASRPDVTAVLHNARKARSRSLALGKRSRVPRGRKATVDAVHVRHPGRSDEARALSQPVLPTARFPGRRCAARHVRPSHPRLPDGACRRPPQVQLLAAVRPGHRQGQLLRRPAHGRVRRAAPRGEDQSRRARCRSGQDDLPSTTRPDPGCSRTVRPSGTHGVPASSRGLTIRRKREGGDAMVNALTSSCRPVERGAGPCSDGTALADDDVSGSGRVTRDARREAMAGRCAARGRAVP